MVQFELEFNEHSADMDEQESTVSVDSLRKDKRTKKMQLTKLYTRLVRLISDDNPIREDILQCLEDYQDKKFEVLEVIEGLISIYREIGDERSAVKIEEELDNVTSEADKDVATVKEFLLSTFAKPSPSKLSKESASEEWDMTKENKISNNITVLENNVDRKMQPIQIAKFYGDKTKFEQFWAAFTAVVDQSNESSRYKMIRLKSYLEGKAAESVMKLGYTDEAYKEAKAILERKFGGDRRELQNYLDDLRRLSPIQERNLDEIEKFTDHLISTVVKLKEKERSSELKPNSMLYTLLLEKLPKTMLADYFRWTKEQHREESIETLRDWLIDETEYRIRALESRDGLSSNLKKQEKSHRSFSTMDLGSGRRPSTYNRSCVCCDNTGHRIWDCDNFIKELSVQQRWELAKEKRLCFRCLTGNHRGKDCRNTRVCGVDGCRSNHHKLLHQPSKPEHCYPSTSTTAKRSLQTEPDVPQTFVDSSESKKERDNKVRNGKSAFITTSISEDTVSFRTIPVWLKANGKKIKVNAVLDDASSASYMNEEIAGALNLSVPYEPVVVQTLNENVETFDSMPVKVTLESTDGNHSILFSAYTCPRQITGKYRVVDWDHYQSSWPHLQVCKFPTVPDDPIVDVLIGQDHIDLHHSQCDVKGAPGEPIARLGPLGWSCIGSPMKNDQERTPGTIRSHYAYTFFTKPKVFEEINHSLKRFWEIDSLGTQQQIKPMTNDERIALEKVRASIEFDGQRYQVGVPWRQN